MSLMRGRPQQQHYHPPKWTTWYMVVALTVILALMVLQYVKTGSL